jgi:hypothetical protein
MFGEGEVILFVESLVMSLPLVFIFRKRSKYQVDLEDYGVISRFYRDISMRNMDNVSREYYLCIHATTTVNIDRSTVQMAFVVLGVMAP